MLIEQLPPDNALARAREPDWWWYRPEHEYLATLIEVTVAAHSGPKRAGSFRMPRPANAQREARMSWNDFDAYFGGAPDA